MEYDEYGHPKNRSDTVWSWAGLVVLVGGCVSIVGIFLLGIYLLAFPS